MKTIAYSCLHYGTDFLGAAIRSIIDHVDEYYVLYAAQGSHGSRTTLSCPDSREDLLKIARSQAGSKLFWIDGDWRYEHEQREAIHQLVPDADVVLVLDCDEIWGWNNSIPLAQAVIATPARIREIRLPMVHFWRSFYRCVIRDPAYPTRVIYPQNPAGSETWGSPHLGRINHMGYAQRPEIVHYKQHTHGHHAEWRKDIDWYRERFLANAQQDCHPVGSEWWDPEAVNPLDYLPAWMDDHPYFDMDVIGEVNA
jgi:hypothetical protein